MKNDTVMYSSKAVAKRLSVQPVTLRKYAQILEDKGVSFTKDKKGWRTYSEENIRFLEYLCNMKLMGKSLEEAADHIATLYHANLSIAQPAIPLQAEQPFTDFMKAQIEFNQKLMEQLERIEQRQIERDQQLMKAIRETQEAKKQLAATKKKKWWKLWN
jgi:DNA-binding transcriptional MerR regulator